MRLSCVISSIVAFIKKLGIYTKNSMDTKMSFGDDLGYCA